MLLESYTPTDTSDTKKLARQTFPYFAFHPSLTAVNSTASAPTFGGPLAPLAGTGEDNPELVGVPRLNISDGRTGCPIGVSSAGECERGVAEGV